MKILAGALLLAAVGLAPSAHAVGKSTVSDGRGKFTGAYSLNDLIGTYGGAEVHAGASRSSNAQVVTKGDISLALAGTGRGWDLGVGFGKFVIERR